VYAAKAQVLNKVRKELKTQQEKLTTFKIKAKSLKRVEKKMAAVQAEFDQAMKALPDKKELPSLLVGISKAGGSAGLEFLLFQPEPVVDKEFYKEIPLSMTVSGSYHQVADFFFQVANLSRIVNIKDLSMAIDAKNKGKIRMNCSAVTYMFSEQPLDGKSKKNKKSKKGKKK
jgi:type IV pilus assembly protein PilO